MARQPSEECIRYLQMFTDLEVTETGVADTEARDAGWVRDDPRTGEPYLTDAGRAALVEATTDENGHRYRVGNFRCNGCAHQGKPSDLRPCGRCGRYVPSRRDYYQPKEGGSPE